MTSLEIKHALLSYFRFKRQCICASECMNNDVMVITQNGLTIDIEIKVNKYDLWKGEARKYKHKWLKSHPSKNYHANKFYICVPTELLDEAEKWVNTVNNKYGIIECNKRQFYPYHISIIKKASILHKFKSERLANKIMKRVCTENINLIGRLLNEKEKI